MNKHKLLRKIALSSLLILMFQNAAFADGIDIKTVHSGDKTVLTGTVSGKETVTLQILSEGYTLSEVTDENRDDAVAFVSATTAHDDGTFEITARFLESGVYTAYVTAPSQSAISEEKIYFTTTSEYTDLLEQLNEQLIKSDKDKFEELVRNNRIKLGFEENLSGAGDLSAAAELFYTECKNNGLSDNFDENVDTFTKCLVITALKKSEIENAYDYVKDIMLSDTTMSKYAQKHIKTDEIEKYFTKKLSGKSVVSLDDLSESCRNALILTAVKYPDGNMNIKAIFQDYMDIIGITSVSDSGTVYNAVGGKDYVDLSSLKTAYNNALHTKTSGGSGGSGGGGTGSSVSSSSGISNVKLPTTAAENASALKIKFDDLDSVEWAYKDIAELYENGIVNGYNEYSFKPEYPVTREQFVKMLVCAMNYENEIAEDSGFSDVSADGWYEKFVNIAYAKGLINGVGENKFGTGENISRQDMAVIIYNAIKQKGYTPQNAKLAFDDADMCGEYAKQAVAELSSMGIVTGVGDNKFNPLGTATRAEAAVILNRMLKCL